MSRANNYIGRKFGSLTVIQRVENYVSPSGKQHARWLCECECGNQKTVLGKHLSDGSTISCGCVNRKSVSEAKKLHTGSKERLYRVWINMRSRCTNPYATGYDNYGGRGIKVCDEWMSSYPAFKSWALRNGYDPYAQHGECTLDRIDVNGDYSPDNCRFESSKKQSNNKRTNSLISYMGKTDTISNWIEMLGLNKYVVYKRLQSGWSVHDAFEKPVNKRRNSGGTSYAVS